MDSNKINVRRSFIFTPGLKPEMFPKAIVSGADMVVSQVRNTITLVENDGITRHGVLTLSVIVYDN